MMETVYRQKNADLVHVPGHTDSTNCVIQTDRAIINKMFPGYVFAYAINSLSGCICSIVDSLVVSNFLDDRALACTGLAGPLYTLIAMIGSLFCLGVNIFCSRALSRGDRRESNRWFSLALEAGLTLAAVFALLTVLLPKKTAVFLGASVSDEVLLSQFRTFIFGFFLNIPLSVLVMLLNTAANLSGRKRLVANSVFCTIAVDAVLDVVTVKVFHWGIFGIALATTAASLCTALLLVYGIRKSGNLLRFRFSAPAFGELVKLVDNGFSNVGYKALVMVRGLVMNRLAALSGGTAGLCALSIINSLSHLLLFIGVGTGNTVLLMSGLFHGEKDARSLRQLLWNALFYCFVVNGIFAALAAVLSGAISASFVPAAGELRDGVAHALRLYALAIPFEALSECQLRYAQGVGRKNYAHIYIITGQILSILIMFAMNAAMGIDGLWLSFSVGFALGNLVNALIVLAREKRSNAGVVDTLLFMGDSFTELEKNSIDVAVMNADDVTEVSEKISEFCARSGVDRKRSYYAALCMEELAGNVVKHGFKGEKRYNCLVRLFLDGDDIVLRIRDNCEQFDMTDIVYRQTDGDAFSNVGIKLVYGIAKDIRYMNILNTNTLIITI